MRKGRFTEEQMAAILCEADRGAYALRPVASPSRKGQGKTENGVAVSS